MPNVDCFHSVNRDSLNHETKWCKRGVPWCAFQPWHSTSVMHTVISFIQAEPRWKHGTEVRQLHMPLLIYLWVCDRALIPLQRWGHLCCWHPQCPLSGFALLQQHHACTDTLSVRAKDWHKLASIKAQWAPCICTCMAAGMGRTLARSQSIKAPRRPVRLLYFAGNHYKLVFVKNSLQVRLWNSLSFATTASFSYVWYLWIHWNLIVDWLSPESNHMDMHQTECGVLQAANQTSPAPL